MGSPEFSALQSGNLVDSIRYRRLQRAVVSLVIPGLQGQGNESTLVEDLL